MVERKRKNDSSLTSNAYAFFNKAVSKVNSNSSINLRLLGKVVGESVETVNIQAPELAIRIEPKINQNILKLPVYAFVYICYTTPIVTYC